MFGKHLKHHDFFGKGQSKKPIAKKTIELWDAPHLDVPTTSN